MKKTFFIEFKAKFDDVLKGIKNLNTRLKGVDGDAKKAGKGMKDLSKDTSAAANSFGRFNNVISTIGRNLVAFFSVREILRFTKAVFSAASAVEELESKASVVFGSDFARISTVTDQIAESVGRSSSQILKYATDIGAIAEASGVTGDALVELSAGFSQLAVDLASFNNTSDEQAFNALRSGITGETEPLKRFGVVMTEANLAAFALSEGIQQNVKDMNIAQKTVLRYNFILENTETAQGDAERTASSLANQIRRLQGTWLSLQESLGEDATPVAARAIGGLNSVIIILQQNVGTAIGAIQRLYGLLRSAPLIGGFIKNNERLVNLASSAFNIRFKQSEAQRKLVESENKLADSQEVVLNRTIEQYNEQFNASREVSETGTKFITDQLKSQESLQDQLDALGSVGPVGGGSSGGGGSSDKAEALQEQKKLEEELAKAVLKRIQAEAKANKQSLELLSDSVDRRKELLEIQDEQLELTTRETRLLNRLKRLNGDALDIDQAKDFNELLESINENTVDFADGMQDVKDAIEKATDEIADLREESAETIRGLEEDIRKLQSAFNEDLVDIDLKTVEDARKEIEKLEKDLQTATQNQTGGGDIRLQIKQIEDFIQSIGLAGTLASQRAFEDLSGADQLEEARKNKRKELKAEFEEEKAAKENLIVLERQETAAKIEKFKQDIADKKDKEEAITVAIGKELLVRAQLEEAATNKSVENFKRIRKSAIDAYRAGQLAVGGSTLNLPQLAVGGEINGPGSGTSDSILARLSNGEFVQRAAAVNHYGKDFMHAVNNLKFPANFSRNIPGFASGGPVSNSRTANVTINNHGDAARIHTDPALAKYRIRNLI